MCNPLGPYISLVNNSIDQITPYWSMDVKGKKKIENEIVEGRISEVHVEEEDG